MLYTELLIEKCKSVYANCNRNIFRYIAYEGRIFTLVAIVGGGYAFLPREAQLLPNYTSKSVLDYFP